MGTDMKLSKPNCRLYSPLNNVNCNKILVQNQLTINLVNMIFSSTQQIGNNVNEYYQTVVNATEKLSN